MKTFANGLATGLVLQLAVGPVFFFIVNLAIQRSFLDGLAGVLAVTLVDYFYITLSVLGIGKLLENKKTNKVFGIISSIVLIIFGALIIKNVVNGIGGTITVNSVSLLASFVSVFLLTISSPMTIVFFTSLFTAKATEYNYNKKELWLFGFGTGFATLLFMGTSVIIFSLVKAAIPLLVIQILNLVVGCLLVGYGGWRMAKIFVYGK